MADIFEIAGRIHSTSQEGVVTVANEILDSNANKKQSQINSEVETRLNAYETGKFVNVETYAELPASGEVDTIYRVANWDGEQVDTTKYAEYSWDGTQYVLLGVNKNDDVIRTDVSQSLSDAEKKQARKNLGMGNGDFAVASDFTNPDATKRAKVPTVGAIVDGLNDGIYDVSKRNPTGGPNSDGKFTLDYILDNANTLIPTGWRHGGMTISFVDSSDNKYVQYFSKAQSFTTNEEDWEKVNNVSVSQNTTTGNNILNIGDNKAGEFANADKLIKLVGFAQSASVAGVTQVGDVYYNTNTQLLRKCIEWGRSADYSTYETIPYYDGAIYQMNNHLYVWNGSELVLTDIISLSQNARSGAITLNMGDIPTGVASLPLLALESNKTTGIKDGVDIKSMSNGYYTDKGELVIDSSFVYQKVEIDHTKAYRIDVVGESRQISSLVMFDDNDNVVYANGYAYAIDLLVTFPKGIRYFGISCRYESMVNALQVGDYELKQKQITTDKITNGAVTPEKCSFISTKNIYNYNNTEIKHGYYLYDNVLYENEQYFVSNMIAIDSETMYLIQAFNYLNYNYCRWICYYDINGNYLSTYTRQTGDYVFTTPSNAKFMMFTGYEAESHHYVVSKDTTINTYIPYQMTIEKEYLPVEAPILPDIVVARKSYILNGEQNSIYFKDIMDFNNPNLYAIDRYSGQWLFKDRCMRTEGTDTDMSIKLVDITDLKTLKRVNTTTCKGLLDTDNGLKVINVIGDSFTYNGKWFDKINELCPNLSFVGMRKSYNTNAALRAEGRGGWTLHDYATKDFDTRAGKYYEGFSPFLHPSGYTYYGVTGFWADIVNNNIGSHTYEMNGFDDFISMFGTDGKKLNPSENDMMYDTTQGTYIYYNGSSWVAYSGTPTFEFNYSKYITAWGITSPDFVLIMLGVNDFFSNYTTEIGTRFVNEMQALITSIQAYATSENKTITIGICTNNTISALPSSNYGTNNILNSRYLFNGRKKVISTFDNATYEAQNVYVVDTAATFDADYGFVTELRKPFSYYEGDERELYDSNGVHPSDAGYSQLGTCAAGFIQYIRGL